MKTPVITLKYSGISFPSKQGSSILDSATEGHVVLPYSCKTGRCGSCKCKLLKGLTNTLHPELGLTEDEKRSGWILSCVRSASEDVTIDADDLSGVSLPLARTLPCKVSELSLITPDIMTVKLRFPPSTEFDFLPGQYVDVIGPHGVRRSYSLANEKLKNGQLELHIRRVEGGAMSDYWFTQAKRNDLLRLNGPLGTFFLRQTSGVDLIFLATGTGIAPINAMLGSLRNAPPGNSPKSVTLLWGARNRNDFYLDMTDLSLKQTYIPVCSRPDEAWTGSTGHVQDVLVDMGLDLSNAAVYACGSIDMIRSAEPRLLGYGLSPGRFYSDAFVCSSTS